MMFNPAWLDHVNRAAGCDRNGRAIAGTILSDVRSAISASICLGVQHDDNRSMPLRINSLGKLGAADCHAGLLVQAVPIYRCR